jgi:hypothetical protein
VEAKAGLIWIDPLDHAIVLLEVGAVPSRDPTADVQAIATPSVEGRSPALNAAGRRSSGMRYSRREDSQ